MYSSESCSYLCVKFLNIFLRYLGPAVEGDEQLMAIFASDFGIEVLESSPHIFVNGTFDVSYFSF